MSSNQSQAHHILSFPEKVERFQTFILYDLAGPKVMFFRTQLNFFKGTTFLWILWLMYYFKNYSSSMYLYLFLHGTYGICWVVKDIWFTDKRIMQKGSICSQFVLFCLLVAYWMIPLPLAAGYGVTHPSKSRIIALVAMYIVGVVLMLGSDYQKNTILRKRKGLISDGFFKYTRNPNYLGEIFIYTSFVLCSGHILGFLIFYTLGASLFVMNMYVKEQCSYKKKQGWEEYSKRSYILLPKIFQTFTLNFVFYCVSFVALTFFFIQESPKTFFYPLDKILGFK